MLVIGGMQSLSGAVAGMIPVSVAVELLRHVARGMDLGIVALPILPGIREVVLAVVMSLVLIFRPQGLLGAELRPPAVLRRRLE